MKTLREKLFVSVGVILLVVAILNYCISEMWVRRELEKAGCSINQNIECLEQNFRDFFSFVVSYQVVHGAAELDGLSKVIAGEITPQMKANFWTLAAKVAAFNPEIAFVQLGDAAISPETTNLYSPNWAFENEILWIQIPEKNALYIAIASGAYYGLFDTQVLSKVSFTSTDALTGKLAIAKEHLQKTMPSHFKAFQNKPISFSWRDPITALFQALLDYETRWVEKMDLVQALAGFQEQKMPIPIAGLLKVDPTMINGFCVLTEEIFLSAPILADLTSKPDSPIPFLLLRKNGNENVLDMARVLNFEDGTREPMAVGFSVSSLISKIARIIERAIIITWDGEPLGFTAEGEAFDPQKDFALTDLTTPVPFSWRGSTYIPNQIDLQELQLTILTPESKAMATIWFLDAMRDEISLKITLSLIVAAFFSFVVALLLLNNISKKFTKPLVCLTHAAEELGQGKHKGLVLPQLGKRHDEVATLTHSFEKMVGELRDRDKIRGVLNKVVSKEITEEILKGEVELGGEERMLTLLFSDIRGFTHFSEHLQPKALIELLNTYMTHMCRIIDETQGVVDKFVGDEIMALYGAPVTLPDHPIKAIEAALRMIQDLRLWNEERKKLGEATFEIGIGIHTGIACTGNMGAENRLNYTAIGANVNLAARLCSAANPMQILISEATYQFVRQSSSAQERFHCEPLPPLTLKGIDHPVPVWSVT